MKTDVQENGVYTENGIKYNRYGVCLDCNHGNPECTHNSLSEVGGKTVCTMCGLVVKD